MLYQCKAWARNALRRAGLQKRRPQDRSTSLLQHFGVQVVFDVGANHGQYARRIQAMGYSGRIVSFEPVSTAFAKLRANARGNRSWIAVQLALSDRNGPARIHVAGNSQSSSLLDMLPLHREAAPASAYVGEEQVEVRTLDSVIDQYCTPADRCFLKLDVQGGERAALDGAANSLPRFLGVQLEMSVAPLYQGQPLLAEMLEYLTGRGYCLASLENGWMDARTQRLLQVEGVFYRRDIG
jgi:FkbM family methyltransferase